MGDIRVSFDQPVDPATLTDTSFSVFGRWSGVVEGALSVDAAGTTVTFRPSRTMFRGESVTVTLSEAIQATSGAALSKGYFLPFYVASAPGTGLAFSPLPKTRQKTKRAKNASQKQTS